MSVAAQSGANRVGALAERCNDFLMSSGPAGREALGSLARAGQEDERLHTFNRSPLIARPGLLGAEAVASLERDLATLLDLMVALPDRLFDGSTAAMCDRVGIDGPARQAVLDTAWKSSVLLARSDVVWSDSGPRAIEFNIHSSLGGMDIAPLNETFLELPVYGDFLRAEALTYRDPLDSILAEVLRAADAHGISGSPTIALVDWPTTYPVYAPVLERVCALMRARGLHAVHAHLGALERRHGYLWTAGVKIDIVYRIFMLEDIPEQPELIRPLIETHRAGQVLLAMDFGAELVGNKASLALLSEPTDPDFVTADERACLDRILPQTRLLQGTQTTWDGEVRDVSELAVTLQEELVLKPAIGHGTLGVTAGWSVSAEQWRRALLEARGGGSFVLQQRVVAQAERVPMLEDGQWQLRDYAVNWGVFIHQRHYAGAMLRALPSSRSGVISLGAGGAVGCCFHQDTSSPRHV